MNEEGYLIKNKTFVGLVKWMNEKYKLKRTGKPFKSSDIQSYIRRGNIPSYLGGNEIERVSEIEDVCLYNVKS